MKLLPYVPCSYVWPTDQTTLGCVSMEIINHRRAQLSGTVLNNVDARVLHSDASREMLASATQV
jgi:hypothetical protein